MVETYPDLRYTLQNRGGSTLVAGLIHAMAYGVRLAVRS